MEESLVVARLLGAYLIAAGLFLIFRGKTVSQLMRDLFDHPAIEYLVGMFLIVLSALYLMGNNIWDGSWRTVITVLVWITLIKGVLYLFAPEVLHKLVTKKVLNSISLWGIIALVGGLYLFFIG